MRIRYPTTFAMVSLAIVGCQPGESQYVGAWKAGGTAIITINPDHTWTEPFTKNSTVTGTWTVEDEDLVMTPTTIQGQSVAEVKKKMLQIADRFGSQAAQMATELDKPDYFKISSDGTLMHSDRKKPRKGGAEITLKKAAEG